MIPVHVEEWLRTLPQEVREGATSLRARCDRGAAGVPVLKIAWPALVESILQQLADWQQQHQPPSVRLAFLDGAGSERPGGWSKSYTAPRRLEPAPFAPPPVVLDAPPEPEPQPDRPLSGEALLGLLQGGKLEHQIGQLALSQAGKGDLGLAVPLLLYNAGQQQAADRVHQAKEGWAFTQAQLLQIFGSQQVEIQRLQAACAQKDQVIQALALQAGNTTQMLAKSQGETITGAMKFATDVGNRGENFGVAMFSALEKSQTDLIEARREGARAAAGVPERAPGIMETLPAVIESVVKLKGDAGENGTVNALKKSIKKWAAPGAKVPPVLAAELARLSEEEKQALFDNLIAAAAGGAKAA